MKAAQLLEESLIRVKVINSLEAEIATIDHLTKAPSLKISFILFLSVNKKLY